MNKEMESLLMVNVLFFTMCNLYFVQPIEALWLNLPAKGTKCVSEEINSNIIVLANYFVIATDHNVTAKVSAKVTSPYGNTLHDNKNITHGQYAFTTHEAGNYMACFSVEDHHRNGDVSVNLDWKTGIAAKDWESVAKKEKIEGVELELRKLEGAVDAIYENILTHREREAELRTLSELTNSRVAIYSIMSLGICILASVWQLWHLTRYFQKKKLI